MQATPFTRDDAFQLVANAVEDRAAQGGRSYAASLKPELQRRTSGAFDERSLGFGTFGEFLHGAERAGFITVVSPPGGHLEALPVGRGTEAQPVEASPDAAGKRGTSVRPDLWAAFVNWDPHVQRVYDVSSDKALVLREGSAPEGFPVSSWRAQTDRYRLIEPVSERTHVEWMHEFTERCEDPLLKRQLTAALADPVHPATGFVRVLRAVPEQRTAWRKMMLDRVVEHIQAWARMQGISLQIWSLPGSTRPTRPSSKQKPDDEITRLRARLHQAIERMSFADLLRVSVPAEFWYES